jgi:hypothetical protein
MLKLVLPLALAFVIVIVAACGGEKPSPTSTPTGGILQPTPTAVVTQPTPAPSPQVFFLTVLSPLSETVVSQSPIEVRGRTVVDAVVSVNGQVVPVNATGEFSTQVSLVEGPNDIEVIASDFRGGYETHVITVIYVPQ